MDAHDTDRTIKATRVPIASLQPFEPLPHNAYFEAVVSLVWPYSSATHSAALLLAEPDFRLRRERGQVRVQLAGPTARAVAESRIGIGDIVNLYFEGATWIGEDSRLKTPGRSVEAELIYRKRIVLGIQKDDGVSRRLEVNEPPSPPPQVSSAPSKAPVASTVSWTAKKQESGTADSPFRMSLEAAALPLGNFVDDYELEERPRKRMRISNLWRYEREPEDRSGPPGPTKDASPSAVRDELQLDGANDPHEASEDQIMSMAPKQMLEDSEMSGVTENESFNLQAPPIPHQERDRSSSSQERPAHSDLSRLETNVDEEAMQKESRPSPKLTTPSFPQLRPIPPAFLDVISPLAPLKQSIAESQREPQTVPRAYKSSTADNGNSERATGSEPKSSPVPISYTPQYPPPSPVAAHVAFRSADLPLEDAMEAEVDRNMTSEHVSQVTASPARSRRHGRIVQDTYQTQSDWKLSMSQAMMRTFPIANAEANTTAGSPYRQASSPTQDHDNTLVGQAYENPGRTRLSTSQSFQKSQLEQPQTSSPLSMLETTPTRPSQLTPQPSSAKRPKTIVIDLSSNEEYDEDPAADIPTLTRAQAGSPTAQTSSTAPVNTHVSGFPEELVQSPPSRSHNIFASSQMSNRSDWTDKTWVPNSESDATDLEHGSSRPVTPTPAISVVASPDRDPLDQSISFLPSSPPGVVSGYELNQNPPIAPHLQPLDDSAHLALTPPAEHSMHEIPTPTQQRAELSNDAQISKQHLTYDSTPHRPSSAVSPIVPRKKTGNMDKAGRDRSSSVFSTSEEVANKEVCTTNSIIDSTHSSPVQIQKGESEASDCSRRPPQRRASSTTPTQSPLQRRSPTMYLSVVDSASSKRDRLSGIMPSEPEIPNSINTHETVDENFNGHKYDTAVEEALSEPRIAASWSFHDRVSQLASDDDDKILYRRPSVVHEVLTSPHSANNQRPSLQFEQITPEASQLEQQASVEEPHVPNHRVDQILDRRLPPTPAPSDIPADMVPKPAELNAPVHVLEAQANAIPNTEVPKAQPVTDHNEQKEVTQLVAQTATLRGRVTKVPKVLNSWFTSEREPSVLHIFRRESGKKPREQSLSLGPTAAFKKPSNVGFTFAPSIANDDEPPSSTFPNHISGLASMQASTNLTKNDRVHHVNGFRTKLSYYTPLSSIEQLLNSAFSIHDSTIDVMAIVTSPTSSPERAKKGPKDYFTILHISDQSSELEEVRVEIFRPFKHSLPVANTGDVVILRNFVVRSQKRKCYLLSGETSAWHVWRYIQGKAEEECRGPPVEIGECERQRVLELRATLMT